MSVIWSNEVDKCFEQFFWTPAYDDERDNTEVTKPEKLNLIASCLIICALVYVPIFVWWLRTR